MAKAPILSKMDMMVMLKLWKGLVLIFPECLEAVIDSRN